MDIDQDGHLDIISGSYSRMEGDMAGLFQVLYGQSGGKFKKAEALNGSDGKPLILPGNGERADVQRICTRPFVVDWDGDGKLDIVTGNFEGGFFWFKGEGKGKFNPKAEPIMVDGKPLKLPTGGHHSDPFIVDFDGDGDLDLMSGSTDGGVYIAENIANKGKPPVLKPFKAVIFPAGKEWAQTGGKARREADLKRPTYGCRIWVEDVNGDGKLDILVGDQTTLATPKKGITDAEMEKKYAEWEKEYNAASETFQKAIKGIDLQKELSPKDQETYQKASAANRKVYEKRTEFMTEEMTGFVWLYLQK